MSWNRDLPGFPSFAFDTDFDTDEDFTTEVSVVSEVRPFIGYESVQRLLLVKR